MRRPQPHSWQFWRMPVSTVLGVAIGIVAAYSLPQYMTFFTDIYDRLFPVVVTRSRVVSQVPGALTLRIVGEKMRGEECHVTRVFGYATDSDGQRHLVVIAKPKAAPPSSFTPRSRGLHDFGEWEVSGIPPQAVEVQVYVEHSCDGRLIVSRFGDAVLLP